MDSIKKLSNGYYNNFYLQVEPMVAWATTTEFGIRVWSRNSISVIPYFESRDNTSRNLYKAKYKPKLGAVLARTPVPWISIRTCYPSGCCSHRNDKCFWKQLLFYR